MSTTAWYFDFRETWADNQGRHFDHTWSSDPILSPQGQEVSVQEFADAVNQLFQQAIMPLPSEGGTYGVYELVPSVHFIDDGDGFGAFPARSDFAIRYVIHKVTLVAGRDPAIWHQLVDFTVELKDGRHGYNTPIILNDGPVPRGLVEFHNYPDTRGLLLHHHSATAMVTDRPPVPPYIDITPFLGVSNRLMLTLNSNTGEFESRPVVLKASDVEYIASEYAAQGKGLVEPSQVLAAIDDPASPLRLTYRNDDPVYRYEIFRLTTRPTSYLDFDTVENPHRLISGQLTPSKRSTMATLIDEIEPNTKYYYCARAIDVHNNFSNPTSVFEAQMVDNEGQIYLILKPILFSAAPTSSPSKAGRKYLYIEPSIRNLSIPSMPASGSNASDNPGAIYGATDGGTSCWTKTFKVRLTSKKTSKKVDLNITFKNTGVINP